MIVKLGGGRFSINSIGMIRRLAALDMGVIVMPEQLVADDVAAGRLRRVLPTWQGESVPVDAITQTRLLPAKTQHFIEFLHKKLRKSG
ncbi:LysR substrate-binding domain-containing protein [Pseudomonas yamanorum]|uniref:LysR substrate-binding domain-containing protein n=1 Tax=Pseudomonas yamanorum TaxID=515393 RepID=UPI000AC6A218|nr:LysR substrate-binding domain-containing protein [Pseudomonas yamanorum]